MKSMLLLAGILTFSSFGIYAQIDDVVNKPKLNKYGVEVQKLGLFKRMFSEVEITQLVDEMKRDNVLERKFQGVLGIDGRIFDVVTDEQAGEFVKFVPFHIRLTTDHKVQVSVALIDIGMSQSSVLNKLQILGFEMDEGVEFRDVKTMFVNVANVDIKIPANLSLSSTLYINIGMELKIGTEKIILDNGQEISIEKSYNGSYRWDGENIWYWGNKPGWTHYSIAVSQGFEESIPWSVEAHGGLGYEKKFRNKSKLHFQGMVHLSETRGSPKGQGGLDYSHSRMILSPEVNYSFKLGKKSRLSFGAGVNLSITDQIKENESGKVIDLGSRVRQPVQGSVKFSF